MKKNFLLFVTIVICTISQAQLPGISWQKSLGGTGAEEAKSVQPTPDGGYIVGGTTSSNDGDVTGNHGGKDCWVVKLNPAGETEWKKTYGGSRNETFASIRVTADGGYIMGATTLSNDGDVSGNHGGNDAWVVKLNNTGDIVWQQCFGSSWGDELFYVEETQDGGYICLGIAGTNDGDLTGQLPGFTDGLFGGWMFKLSSQRTIEWQSANFDSGGIGGGTQYYQIRQTADSGYVYSGFSRGIVGAAFLGKLNSAGAYVNSDYADLNMQGGMYEFLAPRCIAPTNDGGCVAVRRNEYTYYPVLRKYNSALVLQWQKPIEVFGDPTRVTTTPDGGYLITGNVNQGTVSSLTNVPGGQGGADFWLVKLNSAGTVQWQRMLGSASSGDYANWGEAATDSSYIVAGRADTSSGDVTGNHGGNDFWVVKLPYSSPSFAIISSAGTNGTISPNGGLIYPLGINQIFTITPNAGYGIADVQVDGVSNAGAINSGRYTFTNVNASHTINAAFAVKTYTITATSGGNGLVTPLGGSTVNYGSNKTYAITPATGYSILDVLIDSIPYNPVSSYTFSNITANHTIRGLFARTDSIIAYVCTAGDSGKITSDISGASYRWQINSGNGFVNLYDGANFGGTRTATLTIRNYTAAAFGYKYRCVVDGQSSLVNILRFGNTWNGAFDNHWEIPQNWSCGRLPDSTTDVTIPAGTNLIISTNITVRSLSLGTGANVTIGPGGNLNILH